MAIYRSHKRKKNKKKSSNDNNTTTVNNNNTNNNNVDYNDDNKKFRKKIHPNINSNVTIRLKKDWEIPRKILHSSIGFLVLLLYKTTDKIVLRNYLLLSLILISLIEFLRFNNSSFNNLYIKLFGFLMRESEKHHGKINGVIYYIAGCVTVLTLFPKDISGISILILSWCDTAASVVGRKYGKYTYKFSNGKTLAGTSGAIVVGTIIGLICWSNISFDLTSFDYNVAINGNNINRLLILSLYTGIISGISELVDIHGLDDNLILPIFSGCSLWLFLIGFGFGGKI